MTVGEVNTRVVGLAELYERDTQVLYDPTRGMPWIVGLYITASQMNSLRIVSDDSQVLQTHRDHVLHIEIISRNTDHRLSCRVLYSDTAPGLSLAQARWTETLRVIRDMRREMSDMQAELLALREQRRTVGQSGPEARIPDHQEAFWEPIVTFSDLCYRIWLGAEGVVGLTRWIEKMESVFHISGCAVENQVKFATCTLLGAALTWWKGEIKKLEIELWNLKVKGNDVPAYTERFQELTLICTKFVANETEKVDKYISGLPDNIYGNVKSARPKTLDETIELANDLMGHRNSALRRKGI
ncbi:hypothetical protein Tco_0856661 [Tanacetum coccineum]|uniref:Retrotransposon gag domain-containing protein n=1 Tax=Tanacetum coccineum TaxID=301880 RepID=A0ABQ5B5T6_9ASTR